MIANLLLLAALLVVLGACVVLATRLRARQNAVDDATPRPALQSQTEKSALRQLRLASHNLRAIGMTLQGHAEHQEGGGPPDNAGIANAAVGVLDIADYMHEWAEHAESTHVLNEEVLPLRAALDEATSTVALAIRPGQRRFQVDPDALGLRLRADRRALRHVLIRALSVAARASGRDDTIEIRVEGAELDDARRAIALVVEAVSADGSAGPAPITGGGPDLRLTLARALMEAHGGRLDVQTRAGLTVHIAFPVDRIIRGEPVPEEPRAEAPRRRNDDRSVGVSVS